MKKTSYEDIKSYVEEAGYILDITKEDFIKQNLKVIDKFPMICPKEHRIKMNFNNFKNLNRRCEFCSTSATKSYEEIKINIEKRNFILDTTKKEWTEKGLCTQGKLTILCHEGHKSKKSYTQFNKSGCQVCSGLAPKSYDEIKSNIESKGHILNSPDPILSGGKALISTTPISIICPEGHESIKSYNQFMRRGCVFCSKTVKKLYGDIKYNFEVDEYSLITTESEFIDNKLNARSSFVVKCPRSHTYKIRYSHFVYRMDRCLQCQKEDKSINKNIKIYLRKNVSNTNFINKYLKNDINYNNWLTNPEKYGVDHKIPILSFYHYLEENNLTDNKSIKFYIREHVANEVINLQLMERKSNRIKSGKYSKKEFDRYMRSNGYLDEIERLKNEI